MGMLRWLVEKARARDIDMRGIEEEIARAFEEQKKFVYLKSAAWMLDTRYKAGDFSRCMDKTYG